MADDQYYPDRSASNRSERRMRDLELMVRNMHKTGNITEVKFDKEKKRWYVKMADKDGDDAWKSDWLPWRTFSSGSIKISIPPKVGQSVEMHAPGGVAENGTVQAWHNNPDTPSPHDKEDEFFMRVEMPSKDGKPGTDKNQILDFKFTKDGSKVNIGDTEYNLSKDSASTKTKNNSVETDNDTTKAKESHSIETKNRTVKAEKTDIKSASYSLGGKVLINC